MYLKSLQMLYSKILLLTFSSELLKRQQCKEDRDNLRTKHKSRVSRINVKNNQPTTKEFLEVKQLRICLLALFFKHFPSQYTRYLTGVPKHKRLSKVCTLQLWYQRIPTTEINKSNTIKLGLSASFILWSKTVHNEVINHMTEWQKSQYYIYLQINQK